MQTIEKLLEQRDTNLKSGYPESLNELPHLKAGDRIIFKHNFNDHTYRAHGYVYTLPMLDGEKMCEDNGDLFVHLTSDDGTSKMDEHHHMFDLLNDVDFVGIVKL